MSEAVTDYRYEISTLWIIRVLMDLGCIKRLHGFADESIYAAVGWPEKEEFSTEAFAEHVRQVRSSIEKREVVPKI